MTNRAVLYARVSTDNQENNTSLSDQFDKLSNYAARQQYEVVEFIKEIASGADPERQGLNQLRELARHGSIDVVVCLRVDRFMRDVLEGLSVMNELQNYSVRVEFLETPTTGNDGLDKLLRMMLLWKGESEREIIQKRMMDGKISRLKEGRVMPTPTTAYGYEYWGKRDEKGNVVDSGLRIVESEATTVRLIYQWYCFGKEDEGLLSIAGITRELSKMRIPTRRDNKKRTDKGVWQRATVRTILSNEIYKGTWYYNRRTMKNGKQVMRPQKDWIAVEVPAIVSPEIWGIAERRRQQNKVKARRNRKREYLLSGMIVCSCGCRWNGQYKTRRDGTEVWYYVCAGYWYQNSNNYEERRCELPAMRADKVEPAVWQYVWNYLTDPQQVYEELKRRQSEQYEEIHYWQDRVNAFQKIKDDCQMKMSNLLDQAITGDFPRLLIGQKRDELQEQMSKADEQLAYYQGLIDNSEMTNQQIEDVVQFTQKLRGQYGKLARKHKRQIMEVLEISLTVRGITDDGRHVLEVKGVIPRETIVTASSAS